MRSPRARRASSAAVRAFVVRILSGIVPCGYLTIPLADSIPGLSPGARLLTIASVDASEITGGAAYPGASDRSAGDRQALGWMACGLNDCQAKGTTTRCFFTSGTATCP